MKLQTSMRRRHIPLGERLDAAQEIRAGRLGVLTAAMRLGVPSEEIERWVASADSRWIYNYSPEGTGGELSDLVVYNFDREALHLERIYLAPGASQEGGKTLEMRHSPTLGVQG